VNVGPRTARAACSSKKTGPFFGTHADIDWPLKELLERHRRIGYVLAGSERTIIEQMIGNKKTGLWKLVDVLDMKPIEPEILNRWLVERAAARRLELSSEAAGAIIRLAWPRTRDIVQLARAV
jgi:hypothetical protein